MLCCRTCRLHLVPRATARPSRFRSAPRLRSPHTRLRSGDVSPSKQSLKSIVKRKQEELTVRLGEDEDAIEDRISAALESENPNPHRFAQLGRPVLIFELDSSLFGSSSEVPSLAALAKEFEDAHADCLCLSTDTPTGGRDLFMVTRAVDIPVMAKDWYIHPIQILEAKEAGVAGIFGVAACITLHGTPLLSSYAAAIGIDAPVEVLNLKEVEEMIKHGVPMFSINSSVGLSISGISGAASDLTRGIVQSLPFGATSVIGVKTEQEVRSATEAGADALLLKHSYLPTVDSDLAQFVDNLKYICSGDD